nr:hypothetical protein [Tanacetum cinerariifolium]
MDSEVVKDSGKKDDSSDKQAGSRKKRAGLKLKAKSPNKLKVLKEQESAEDDQEKEELRLCLKITQLLGSDLQGEDLSYWKITRADGSFRFYKIFSTMLEEFNRQDLFDLHRLLMKRFESVAPEGYHLIFLGDLKTMIEPNEKDEVWRNQQKLSVISWKLYEYYGVHTLLMDGTLICINMLVEKKHPLTKEMLTRMLNPRLEADLESTMAFELIRFIKAQLEE